MISKHQRDQEITLNKDGDAGEKTKIVYSCAGPRIAPEEPSCNQGMCKP